MIDQREETRRKLAYLDAELAKPERREDYSFLREVRENVLRTAPPGFQTS